MIIVPVYCIFFKCQALLFRQRAFFAHFNNKLIMLDQPADETFYFNIYRTAENSSNPGEKVFENPVAIVMDGA